jgi:hypothetical protein
MFEQTGINKTTKQGLISPTFYVQLLSKQIPKAQKRLTA